MHEASALWSELTLGGDATRCLTIGPLTIWLKRQFDELHYAAQVQAPGSALTVPEGTNPEGCEWKRWVCGPGDFHCRIMPVLPPRAVVVRPAMTVQVLPGQSVEFYVSIPVWLALQIEPEGPATPLTLLEVPTITLSNSWFGTPVDGELCYALKTRARRRLEELRSDVHLAVCPLTLKNSAPGPLIFERLCLRVQHMSLYAGASHLWTNHGRLVYRGEESMTEFTFDDGPPACDAAGQRLAVPRAPVRQGTVLRALHNFKSIRMFTG